MSALAQPVRAPFNTTLIISRDSDERKISVPVATDSTRKASTATQIVNRRQSDVNPDIIWSFNQHSLIIQELLNYDCKYIKGRDEYTLLKEVVTPDSVTEVASFSKGVVAKKPVNSSKNEVVSIHPMGVAYASNDTTNKKGAPGSRTFLVPLDVQKKGSIAEVISSFRVIQSAQLCLNIGFDTEFQDFRSGSGQNRRVLSLQMSIAVGTELIRYFFWLIQGIRKLLLKVE